MKTIIKIIAIAFTLFVLEVAVCSGQSCTTATCNAATPSLSDVLAALPSPSNTNATVVVNIPAGSASWTSSLVYTIPAAVTNLTIQGATTINWTGTPGTSSYAYTLTDLTSISDSIANNNPVVTITVNGTGTKFRMTGITFKGGNIGSTSNNKYSGYIAMRGNAQGMRLDHLHFDCSTYTPFVCGGGWIRPDDSIIGVIDHNVFDSIDHTILMNGVQAYDPVDDTIGNGDGSFANATGWGGPGWLFVESNYFKGGADNDCADGARMVFRYNTSNDAYLVVQEHGTKSTAGPQRGCRAVEAYHNYIFGATGAGTQSGATGTKIGTQLNWGNTMDSHFYRWWQAATDRNTTNQPETNTPQGWGYCSTNVTTGSVGSAWDGNQPTIATGYPCLDNLGRGQDVQPLNGKDFCGNSSCTINPPGRLNSVTGTIAWSHQYLEPDYMWMNNVASATNFSSYALVQDLVSQNNRDYYYDCGSVNSTCSGGFTGAAGTGYGLLSARPSTCTAGPGGTYGTSPTGSYGVAYWATDANSGNGELYVCTATNTWTPIYQPYVYPHPLVSGGTTFTWTQTITPTGGGTITGGSSGTYASGTTIGPLTATPSTGYSLASPIWSAVTGSAGCSGSTNPCPSFSLTTNSTATATFVINSYTLSTANSGSGTGTVTCTPAAGSVNYNTPVSCVISPTGGSAVSTVTGCGGTWTTSPYGFTMPASNCTVTATFIPPAATPTFSPAAGSYGAAQTVTISTTTAGATILYTNNGSTPACPSTGTTYSTPVTVSTSQTLRAVACATGYASSAVGSAAYIINGTASTPSASPAAGTYTSVQSVTLSSSTSGATICYTTDGTAPTANGAGTCTHGTTYTTAISVSTSQTIKFIASKSGFTDSSVGSAAYVINLSPATTTIQCNPCVVRGTVTIQ